LHAGPAVHRFQQVAVLLFQGDVDTGPQQVAEDLVAAVNAQDVDGALALFAEDAVVDTGGPEPYTRPEEIRGWLEELAAANFSIEAEILEVTGETVIEKETLSMDPWMEMGISKLEGVSELRIQDGRILSLKFTLSEASLEELRVATLRSTQPAHANIAYVDDGSPDHLLDLYLPDEGTGPFPVILLIHGSGDTKEDHNGMAGFFNQSGFAAVLISYSESSGSSSDSDAACSLAWTLANADKYGLDPDRITVFGFSVGGMVAATIGSLDNRADLLESCPHQLPPTGGMLGIAAYEGVFGTPEECLAASWCLAGAASGSGLTLIELQPIFETLRDTDPGSWSDPEAVGAEAEDFARQFPLYWLDGSEPPFLIIHGSGEDGLPRRESEAFASWLQSAGVEVELVLLPTASHQSVYPSSPSFPDIAGAIVSFAEDLSSR